MLEYCLYFSKLSNLCANNELCATVLTTPGKGFYTTNFLLIPISSLGLKNSHLAPIGAGSFGCRRKEKNNFFP